MVMMDWVDWLNDEINLSMEPCSGGICMFTPILHPVAGMMSEGGNCFGFDPVDGMKNTKIGGLKNITLDYNPVAGEWSYWAYWELGLTDVGPHHSVM